MRFSRLILALLLGLWTGSPCSAQVSDQDVRNCSGVIPAGKTHTDDNLRISGCTALVAVGQEDAPGLYGFSAYYLRGSAYLDQGKYDLAIGDFDQAIGHHPNDWDSYSSRGDAHHARGDFKLAVDDYSAAMRLNPDGKGQLLAFRCRDRAIMDELQDALADCNQAISITEEAHLFDFHFGARALTYLKLKQYQASITDYERALQLNRKSASSWYGLGIAEEKSGNKKSATVDIARAKSLDRTIASTFLKWGIR